MSHLIFQTDAAYDVEQREYDTAILKIGNVPCLQAAYLAQGVSTRARWMLAAFREGMAKLGVEYEGGEAPSSGFIGIYFLLQVSLVC